MWTTVVGMASAVFEIGTLKLGGLSNRFSTCEKRFSQAKTKLDQDADSHSCRQRSDLIEG